MAHPIRKFFLCFLACLANLLPAQIPQPLPWGFVEPYVDGTAKFKAKEGLIYRMERSTGMDHWIALPERYFGVGQTITQFLHEDFTPEVPGSITPQTHLTPQDVLPPTLAAQAVLGAGVPGIEALLQVQSVDRSASSFRQIDMPMTVQLRNRSTTTLNKVQVNVPLSLAFSTLRIQPNPAATVAVSQQPVLAPGSTTPLSPNTTLSLTDTRLLDGTDSLAPGASAAINFTVRFNFTAGWTFPKNPRYLYAVASAGASASANVGVSWDGAGTYTPAPGVLAYEASADRYVWRALGQSNPIRATPIYFFNKCEPFTRWYSVLSFNNGGALISWWSPVEESFVSHYLASGFDLRRTPSVPDPYYFGYTEIYRNFPAPGPGVQSPADLPIFGGPTNIEMSIGTHASRIGAPNAAQMAASVPSTHSEYIARVLFEKQAAIIKQNIISNFIPPSQASIQAGSSALGDRDLTLKTKEFFRVRGTALDSNFNGSYDANELTTATADGWLWNLDDDGDGIPNGYDTFSGAGNSVGLSVIVNEVCSSNSGSYRSPDGASPDWVELYNISGAPVDLTGWQLRDLGSAASWYTFLAGSPISHIIPSGGFMVVFCPGNNAVDTASAHYTKFKISPDGNGEAISLHKPGAVAGTFDLIDTTPSPGPQYTDITFGRHLNPLHLGASALEWGYLVAPTPMAKNSPGMAGGVTSPPTISMTDANTGASVPPGVYSRNEHQALQLNISGGNGGVLHYTTNSAEPTGWSAVFDPNHPPVFDRSVIVRAASIQDGMLPSQSVTQSFLFKESVLGTVTGDPGIALPPQARPEHYPEYSLPQVNDGYPNGMTIPYGVSSVILSQDRPALMAQLSSLPTLSIVVPALDFFDRDTGGSYACSMHTGTPSYDPKGTGWERAGSMEWLHPGNALPALATSGNINCGVSISGNTNISWWRTEKHSLALAFKKEFGASKYQPKFRPFPPEADINAKYDNLILRNPTFDTWSMTDGLPWQSNPVNATYAKDAYARKTLALLGAPQLYYQWVHVYLNGLYWGAYLLSERADPDTCERRFGAGNYYVWKDAKGIDSVGDPIAGLPAGLPTPQAATWLTMANAGRAVAAKATAVPPLDASAEYEAVDKLVNLGSFIDYTIFHAFLGNFDSMTNNGRVYRKMQEVGAPAETAGKFTWFAYDVEVGADINALSGPPGPMNCFETWWGTGAAPPRPIAPYANSEAALLWDLAKYPKFAQRFGDRAWQLCLMPTAWQNRPDDGALTGDNPTGKAQTRFLEGAAEFEAIRLSESLRWGVGWGGTAAAAPRQTTGTAFAVGTNVTLNTGGFFAGRRPAFKSQLEAQGLLSSIPMPSLSPGSAPNTWILSPPALANSETYYNDPTLNNGAPVEPDSAALTTAGTFLAVGTTKILTAPFHLTARTRAPVPGGTTDDTKLWSNLLDIQLPLHP